jgi:hypothetical protein
MAKTYKRVRRPDPDTGELVPFIRIRETRVKVRYIAVSRLQSRKTETQKMLDAQE